MENSINQELVKYIASARASGFADKDIRLALIRVGWGSEEVDSAFKYHALSQKQPRQKLGSRIKKLLGIGVTTALILGIGSVWVARSNPTPTTEQVLGLATLADEQAIRQIIDENAATRDYYRLQNIAEFQEALRVHLDNFQSYPKTLKELVEKNLINTDLKNHVSDERLLYTTLGPSTYALSTVLERGYGTLSKGLHTFTDQKIFRPEIEKQRHESIKNPSQLPLSENIQLIIQDSDKIAINNEVQITLEYSLDNSEIEVGAIVTEETILFKPSPPFNFRFTAPSTPGTYRVNLFIFKFNGELELQKGEMFVVQP